MTLLILGFFSVSAEEIYPLLTPGELKQTLLKVKQRNGNVERVNLMLKLGYHYLIKPGAQKSSLDSASFYIDASQKMSIRARLNKEEIRSRMLLALLYNSRGNKAKFRETLKKAITDADRGNLYHIQGEGTYFLGYYGEENRIELYQNAINCFKNAKSTKEEAFMYKKLGEAYTEMGNGNKELSLQLAMKSLATYKKIKYENLQYVYNMIGIISGSMSNWPDRLKYLLLAIDVSKKTGDTTALSYYYSDLGGTYYGLAQYNDALRYLKLSYHRFTRERKFDWVYHNASLISDVYNEMRQPEKGLEFYTASIRNFPPVQIRDRLNAATYFTQYYVRSGQFDLAAPFCAEMLKLEGQLNRTGLAATNTLYKASMYYKGVGDYAMARHYLNEASKSNVTHSMGSKRNIEYQFFKLDSLQGNLIGAIRHYQRYARFADSVMNDNKLKQITELQVRYETKKKEADLLIKDRDINALNQQAQIQRTLLDQAVLQSQKSDLLAQKKETDLKLNLKNTSLLKQTSKLQQSKLEQASFTKKITISISILLFTIMLLLFRQFRLKQKASRLFAHKNERLEELVIEKNWLLKEVHHRVKNNLQTVISLLESQAAYLKDDALKAMENCQHRIYVMSLIHQKLYQSEEVKTICMPLYISEFVGYLSDSFQVGQRIRFEQQIDDFELSVAQAVPLALIINEAVTNAIKYAFRDGQYGIINLSLQSISDRVYMCVSDNGIGIPDVQLNNTSRTLGLKLMKGLCRDLNAEILIENTNGTAISLDFEINNNYNENQQVQKIKVAV